MDATVPSIRRSLVVLLALVIPSAIIATRPATLAMTSEGQLPQFGLSIAAHGATIASADRDARGRYVLRIDRVADGRVIPEARLPVGDIAFLPSVGIHGDVAAVTLNYEQVRFYERSRGRWSETERLELPAQCRDPFFRDVHLGEDLAVVESRDVWCVFERRGKRWSMATTLPHEIGMAITVSRKRVLILQRQYVYQYTRGHDGWTRTTIVTAADGYWFDRIATSDRWLLLREDGGGLYVHDLDDSARRVFATNYRDGFVYHVGIGPRAFALTGEYGARAWYFVDGRWSDAHEFLEGATSRGADFLHPVAIGDVLWIGDPALGERDRGGGWVHGFTVR